MEIYLIRHGIAEERDADTPDSERELVDEGRDKLKRVAKHLERIGVAFDVLATSPKLRASQTADIIAHHCTAMERETCQFLADDDGFERLCQWLRARFQAGCERVACVGHEPLLHEWLERLVFGRAVDRIVLKKGGVACLTLEKSDHEGSEGLRADLTMLLQPRLFKG